MFEIIHPMEHAIMSSVLTSSKFRYPEKGPDSQWFNGQNRELLTVNDVSKKNQVKSPRGIYQLIIPADLARIAAAKTRLK